jgi:branched-chain amino acid transport system ATP-binding protein
MLELKNVTTEIAGTTILRDVSFSVSKGSMVGLIGRNGAGKTTSLRSIMGLLKLKSGQVIIDGINMTKQSSFERAGMSIGYMPEDRRLVPDLTVEENIMAPAWACKINNASARLAWIYEMMPEVEVFSDRRALQLSGGQQKLVALARAMMTGTQLLLLDEPFEGVAPALSRRLASVLSTLKDEGLTVLLSESDQSHSADLIDKAFLIERGSVKPLT